MAINETVELAKAMWMPLVNIVCFYQYFTLATRITLLHFEIASERASEYAVG